MSLASELLQSVPVFAREIVESIIEAQMRHSLFPLSTAGESCIVVVGLSGGPDSVCLLHALHTLAPIWQLSLHAAHVDHGLRQGSGEDAAFACELANDLDLPFLSNTLDAGELRTSSLGVEAAARDARYAFLQQCSVRLLQESPNAHSACVAVAHHMDDQAETVLMNLIRGSGLRGLGGMPWSREFPQPEQLNDPHITLVRPLLGTTKAAIHRYLDAYQLLFREDESNADIDYLRNRIRHETLPQLASINPQINQTLSRTADLCRGEAARAELLDERMLLGLTFQERDGVSLSIRLDTLLDMPVAPQRGILKIACQQLDIDSRELGFDAIENLLLAIQSDRTASGPHSLVDDVAWTLLAPSPFYPALLALHRTSALPFEPEFPFLSRASVSDGPEWTLECPGSLMTEQWMLECQRTGAADLPYNWRNGRDPWLAYMDAAAVQQLRLTTPKPGMSMAPLGMEGQHKSLGDIFTDKKIAQVFREQWPVLVDAASEDVIWLCGLCLSHSVKVTDSTEQVLGIRWRRR